MRARSGPGCSHLNRAIRRLAHGSVAFSALLRSGNGEILSAHREAVRLALIVHECKGVRGCVFAKVPSDVGWCVLVITHLSHGKRLSEVNSSNTCYVGDRRRAGAAHGGLLVLGRLADGVGVWGGVVGGGTTSR